MWVTVFANCHDMQGWVCPPIFVFVFIFQTFKLLQLAIWAILASITLFKSITMLYGTDNRLRNIFGYFPEQTLWLVLFGCVLIVHRCMHAIVFFKNKILKCICMWFKPHAFCHHFHVCMFWMSRVQTKKLNCVHVVLMCELWSYMCKC